jgi:hypothetical protein
MRADRTGACDAAPDRVVSAPFVVARDAETA